MCVCLDAISRATSWGKPSFFENESDKEGLSPKQLEAIALFDQKLEAINPYKGKPSARVEYREALAASEQIPPLIRKGISYRAKDYLEAVRTYLNCIKDFS